MSGRLYVGGWCLSDPGLMIQILVRPQNGGSCRSKTWPSERYSLTPALLKRFVGGDNNAWEASVEAACHRTIFGHFSNEMP